jgi:hypothetical protein
MRNETASAGLSAAEALATGVIQEMFWTKTRWAALAVLGLGLAGLGGTLAPGREEPASASPRELATKDDAPKKQPAEADRADPLATALHLARVRKQLRTLGQALANYNDAYGHLLPPAIVSQGGKPLLSWRVAILPFIEQDALYKQFHLDEPWDSPHNRKLIAHMPAVFAPVVRTPRPHMTYFQFIVGPDAIFRNHRLAPAWPQGPGSAAAGPGGIGPPTGVSGPRGGGTPAGRDSVMRPGTGAPGTPTMPGGPGPRAGEDLPRIPASITDGTANTILVVEAGTPVVWTKPEDVAYDPKKPLPRLGGQFASVINVATVDGVARSLPRRLDPKTLRAAITPAGGEPIDLSRYAKPVSAGFEIREKAVERLKKRNAHLKEDSALLREALAELKEELDGLRWALEEKKLLALDPETAALQKENARMEKLLREGRDAAREMLAEIKRLQQEVRKLPRK